ncbi:MAG: hypothetical protein L0332_19000 [Chloroflexi bacterium]|nr:hypothetical protein [Chloroflexota bacterium]MCI0644525.1 hypothetical protein [Chloroflexota bacterium]MCI0728786.1 hypothetical protein [Chloroflexota bacterium]
MRWMGVLLLFLGLASLACQTLLGGGEEANENTNVASPTEEAVQVIPPTKTVQPPAEATQPPATAAGPAQSLNLSDPGLYDAPPALTANQIDLLFQYERQNDDGSTTSGQVTGTGGRVVQPPALSLVFNAEGSANFVSGNTFTIVQSEGVEYFVLPTGNCVADESQQRLQGFGVLLDTGGILSGEAPLLEAGVLVNGVLADRYALSTANVNFSHPTAGDITEIEQGSIAVARDGGYVVQVVLDGRGTSALLAGDAVTEGDIYYELNFTPTAESLAIAIPAGCPGASEIESEFPVLEDASQVTAVSGILTYQSNRPFDEIVAFYQEEMAAAGWATANEFIDEPIASFLFTKDGRQVQISVVEDAASDAFIVAIVEQ